MRRFLIHRHDAVTGMQVVWSQFIRVLCVQAAWQSPTCHLPPRCAACSHHHGRALWRQPHPRSTVASMVAKLAASTQGCAASPARLAGVSYGVIRITCGGGQQWTTSLNRCPGTASERQTEGAGAYGTSGAVTRYVITACSAPRDGYAACSVRSP